MKAKEADSIVKFLDSCETLLSNHEMVVLSNGLQNTNEDVTDGAKTYVWWNAAGHKDLAMSKEYREELNEQRY